MGETFQVNKPAAIFYTEICEFILNGVTRRINDYTVSIMLSGVYTKTVNQTV